MSNTELKTKVSIPHSLLIAIIAGVISINAILFAGIAWYKAGRIVGGIEEEFKQRTQAQTNIDALKEQVQQQQQTLTQIRHQLRQIVQLTNNAPELRVLSQVGYSLYLASLHLNVGRDTATALTLLKIAQQRLETLNNPTLYELKSVVAHDIAALEHAPQLNVTALALKLDMIDEQVQKMIESPLPAPPQIGPVDTHHFEHWYSKPLSFLASFKDLIKVRHVNQPIMPLLSLQQQVFLKQNIQIKLNQAQWALLHQSESLYQQSLREVLQWLTQYYPDRPDAQKIITELTPLLSVKMAPPSLNVNASLNALDEALTHAHIATPVEFPKQNSAPPPNNPVKNTKAVLWRTPNTFIPNNRTGILI